MAVPKRKWSKQRTRTRKAMWKLEEPNISKCSHCGEPVLSHRVCKNCGYYNGKEVIKIKEKEA